MYLDNYFDAVDGVFGAIRRGQREAIEAAAEAVAEALSHKGGLFVMDTGHLLRHESFLRAGGLVAFTPFSYELKVESDLENRPSELAPEDQVALEARTVSLALDKGRLRAGDVLLINTNSGRTANVIETALQCRERGIVTIGIASGEQMRRCEAAHPSGKKLFDVAAICIDNASPFGDAAVAVKDNEKMCPLSGLASAYILWAIQAEAVERLQARGIQPTLYRSVHVGGQEHVDQQRQRFLEKGY